ncbi:hypothetical protein CANARDRAFT_107788 [[Candida] arabinofermentans NRRL YB-2248]|uniref:Uncharacterized protein n=1 Tax=[Candida] arabinofermentans NRRL YB-2248 TaxID=983967 RepID=A0A1E4STU0_9ASCO|nr:hypothetical protein CANARDRAFT_107788 [[Candida] arabinofermentans NRRL YB-2248]
MNSFNQTWIPFNFYFYFIRSFLISYSFAKYYVVLALFFLIIICCYFFSIPYLFNSDLDPSLSLPLPVYLSCCELFNFTLYFFYF